MAENQRFDCCFFLFPFTLPVTLPPFLLPPPYLEEGGSVTLLEEGGRRSEGDEVGRREGGKGCPDLRYGPFGILQEEVGMVAGEGGRERGKEGGREGGRE
jgi:hypothetical protein